MFALTMYIMLLTLDDYKPTWQDQLATPGEEIKHTQQTSSCVSTSLDWF